jgi:tetratricopeptide (TPR) repeat protein
VSNKCVRPLAVLATVVSLFMPCLAQSAEASAVKGGLQCAVPTIFRDYYVELVDLARHADIHRVDVQADGAFEFRSVPAGDYRLRVTDLNGDSIYEQYVVISSYSGPLTIQLPEGKKPRVPGGTVSLTQLRHPPAPKAFQAVLSAQHFSETGQVDKAVVELEKAIRISPEYADAYNNLAVQHMRMNRYEDAARELERAIEIAGPSPMKLCNLAYAQHRLQRDPEAIANSRAALRMDSAYPQAHLILGSLLASDPRTRQESITHLEQAAVTLPSARTTLENVRRALR